MRGRLAPAIFTAVLTVLVKLGPQLLGQTELPDLVQEIHPLLGIFDECVNVRSWEVSTANTVL